MQYYLYLSIPQKQFLSNILDIELSDCVEKFSNMLDDSEILEINDLLYDHLYLENYKTFLKNQQNNLDLESLSPFQYKQKCQQIKELAKLKADNEKKRIQLNNKFMSPNIEFETLIDIACHTDYEWIDNTKIIVRSKSLTIVELEAKKIEDLKSFSIKPITLLKNYANTHIESLILFASLKETF